MSFRNKYLRCVFLKTEPHCCSEFDKFNGISGNNYSQGNIFRAGLGPAPNHPNAGLSPGSAPQTRVQAKLLIILSLGSDPNIVNSHLWDNDTTSLDLNRVER